MPSKNTDYKKFVYVAIGFFESLIFSGLIFGWPALVFVLQREGVYSHLCGEQIEPLNGSENFNETNSDILDQAENSNGTIVDEGIEESFVKCREQNEMFGLLYSVMLAAFGIPSVLVGFSLDYFGLRVTRIVGNTTATLGFIFLSFATKELPWTIWPGMLLISVGANTLRLCALQYGNAWPEKRSTIMFLYTSAHAVSTTVFLMFQYANHFGLPLRFPSYLLSTICGATFVSTAILPKRRVEEPLKNPGIEMSQISIEKQPEAKESCEKAKFLEKDVDSNEELPLMASIQTLSFVLHMIWMINVLMLRFYITSFNSWVWKTTDDSSQIAFYNVFAGNCSLISPFVSPIAGFLTDYLTAKAEKEEDKVERLASKFQAPALILGLTTTLLFGVYICKIFLTPAAVYCSIILVSFARPVTIATGYTYVRARFYPEHFNRLTGLVLTAISVVCLLHYPMYLWLFSTDESYFVASCTFCVLILLTAASPGHLLIRKFPLKFAAEEIVNRKNV